MLLLSCDGKILNVLGSDKKDFITMQFALEATTMSSIYGTDTRALENQQNALNVTLGNDNKTNNSTSRSSSGIDETAINEVCVFQFNGTAATSSLIAQTYYNSLNPANLETTLIESSSDQTVYVVANMGDITSNYTIGTTTLSDFQTFTYSFATETSITSGGDLPMVGTYTGATMPGLYSLSLNRIVAKINLTCNINLTNSNDAFEMMTAHICQVPNLSQTIGSTGIYPANTTSDAAKYIDYDIEDYTTSGATLTWYIPENLKGTVPAITSELDKSKENAPAYSTYIEIEGIYTFSGGGAEYVVYRIYPGGNMTTNFDMQRNTYYNITTTIRGINEADRRVLIPENLSINDVGTQVTANCYIVNDPNELYQFNATVMGNGKTTPAATISGTDNGTAFTQVAPAITPTTLSPASAFVIWETGNKGDVIQDGSLKLINNTSLLFRTANNTTNGNALIGVKNASGTLLWSWHIWKTNYAPNVYDASTYDTYTTRTIDPSTYPDYNSIPSRSYKIMKYNLGTTATAANYTSSGVPGELGLYYQWGRKDPFVGATDWTTTSYGSIRITTTNTLGYEWFDGSDADAVAKLASDVASDASGSISYAIKHPTHFIKADATNRDWLHAVNRSEQRDNLWGNPNLSNKIPNSERGSKSIYDPCPPGWMVAGADSYTGFTSTGVNSTTATDFVVSGSYSYGWNFYNDGTTSGTAFYWPAMGYRAYGGGHLGEMGGVGYYWTSSSYGANNLQGDILSFRKNLVQPMNVDGIRSGGTPIRCVQEE